MRGFNQPSQMVLASTSKVFIEGMKRILDKEDDVEVVAEASTFEEIEECLDRIKPEFLFLDNRTIKLELNKLINSLVNQNLYTTMILFNDYAKFAPILPNVLFITKETDSRELLEIVKRKSPSNGFQAKQSEYTNGTKHKLTNREARIAELITRGFSNREIARRLSIAERTVKAHLTNIFLKLEIQNRYQLMVYARQRILNNFSKDKFSTNS